jgi:hypothetical protein
MMSTLPFWLSLVVTVALIATALVSGLRGGRRLHLVCGPAAIVMLSVTIVLTEQLVRQYDFPADVREIHLPCAKAGGLLAVPVVLTGVWLWRSPRARNWHRVAVWVWLAGVLVATATGIWMFSHGTLRTA